MTVFQAGPLGRENYRWTEAVNSGEEGMGAKNGEGIKKIFFVIGK